MQGMWQDMNLSFVGSDEELMFFSILAFIVIIGLIWVFFSWATKDLVWKNEE